MNRRTEKMIEVSFGILHGVVLLKLTGFLDVEPAFPIPGLRHAGGLLLVPPYFLSVFALCVPRRQPTGQTCKGAHRSRSLKGSGEYARVALGLACLAGWRKVVRNVGEDSEDGDSGNAPNAPRPRRGHRPATQRGHVARCGKPAARRRGDNRRRRGSQPRSGLGQVRGRTQPTPVHGLQSQSLECWGSRYSLSAPALRGRPTDRQNNGGLAPRPEANGVRESVLSRA